MSEELKKSPTSTEMAAPVKVCTKPARPSTLGALIRQLNSQLGALGLESDPCHLRD